MLSSAPGAHSRSCPCVTDPPALVHRPPCPPTTRAPLQVLTGAVSPRRASSRSSSTVSVHSGRLAARCIAGCPALHPSEARSSWPDPVWPLPPPRALTGPHSPETHPPEVSCSHQLAAALHSNRSSHANSMSKEAWESPWMIVIVEGFRRNNMTRTFLLVHFICTRIISLEPRENTLHYPHVTEEQTEAASLVWAARPEWRGRDWNPGLLAPGVPRIRCLPCRWICSYPLSRQMFTRSPCLSLANPGNGIPALI